MNLVAMLCFISFSCWKKNNIATICVINFVIKLFLIYNNVTIRFMSPFKTNFSNKNVLSETGGSFGVRGSCVYNISSNNSPPRHK